MCCCRRPRPFYLEQGAPGEGETEMSRKGGSHEGLRPVHSSQEAPDELE